MTLLTLSTEARVNSQLQQAQFHLSVQTTKHFTFLKHVCITSSNTVCSIETTRHPELQLTLYNSLNQHKLRQHPVRAKTVIFLFQAIKTKLGKQQKNSKQVQMMYIHLFQESRRQALPQRKDVINGGQLSTYIKYYQLTSEENLGFVHLAISRS